MSEEKQAPLTFAGSFTRFDLVSSQVEDGLKVTHRASTFFKKLAAIEDRYAKAVADLVESDKRQDLQQKEMKLQNGAWLKTRSCVAESAQTHQVYASKVSTISTSLAQVHAQAVQEHKKLLTSDKRHQSALNQDKVQCKRAQDRCARLLRECEAALAKEQAEKTSPPVNKGLGLLSGLMRMAQTDSSTLLKNCTQAAEDYTSKISTFNSTQKKYYQTQLVNDLTLAEELEASRLDQYKNSLADAQKAFQDKRDEQAKLDMNMGQFNTSEDLQNFINNTLKEQGPYSPPSNVEYSLPVSLAQIKSGHVSVDSKTMFCVSLQRCMELQKDEFKDRVPHIVTVCVRDIVKKGGLVSQGIFRLSVPNDKLNALCTQFDSGDYDIKESSPDYAACLLKKWLRDLAEPLIPTENYADAIAAGRSKDAPSPAHVTMQLVDRLPLINRLVIEEICRLVQQIVFPSNMEVNKMTHTNLAVVFAPCFLRNPSEDPVSLMENMKIELEFVKNLFQSASQEKSSFRTQPEDTDVSSSVPISESAPAPSSGEDSSSFSFAAPVKSSTHFFSTSTDSSRLNLSRGKRALSDTFDIEQTAAVPAPVAAAEATAAVEAKATASFSETPSDTTGSTGSSIWAFFGAASTPTTNTEVNDEDPESLFGESLTGSSTPAQDEVFADPEGNMGLGGVSTSSSRKEDSTLASWLDGSASLNEKKTAEPLEKKSESILVQPGEDLFAKPTSFSSRGNNLFGGEVEDVGERSSSLFNSLFDDSD